MTTYYTGMRPLFPLEIIFQLEICELGDACGSILHLLHDKRVCMVSFVRLACLERVTHPVLSQGPTSPHSALQLRERSKPATQILFPPGANILPLHAVEITLS